MIVKGEPGAATPTEEAPWADRPYPAGKRNQPYYRIVVAEKRSKLTGQYIDLLGNYDPNDPKNKLTIDKKRYADWITKGAKPTDTVRQLVAKQK